MISFSEPRGLIALGCVIFHFGPSYLCCRAAGVLLILRAKGPLRDKE